MNAAFSGVPLSLALTVKTWLAPAWAGAGVQVTTPLAGLMTAPVGASVSSKVSCWTGESPSTASTSTINKPVDWSDCGPTWEMTGTEFSSAMVIVKGSFATARGTPPSVATTITERTVPPSNSLEFQLMMPVTGWMKTPGRFDPSEKRMSPLVPSGSVAEAWREKISPSLIVWSAIGEMTGGTLVRLTVVDASMTGFFTSVFPAKSLALL